MFFQDPDIRVWKFIKKITIYFNKGNENNGCFGKKKSDNNISIDDRPNIKKQKSHDVFDKVSRTMDQRDTYKRRPMCYLQNVIIA